jgi:hypothetical protein
MTYEERRTFFEHLRILVKSEYEEVFRIIKRFNEPYTENSNGIFFDLVKLSTETFQELSTYMEFCRTVRAEQASRDTEEREAQDLLLA